VLAMWKAFHLARVKASKTDFESVMALLAT